MILTSSTQRLTTKTNNSGGIQGGISNGAPIYFRVAFKPPSTIGQAQNTASYDFEEGILEAKGRHDPCVVPRAVPIVEATAALVGALWPRRRGRVPGVYYRP
jgi:chorismate synthase